MASNLKFNGVSSQDLGLVIQAPPTYDFPERDVDVEHVQGRNGDLFIDYGSYKNVTRTYSLAMAFRNQNGFIPSANQIIEWLTSAKGYARLEDSYDPEVYRMAYFVKSGSLQNYYDAATAINVQFVCKPMRYYKVGDEFLESDGLKFNVLNEYGHTSVPYIELSGLTDLVNYNKNSDSVTMISVDNETNGTVSSISIDGLNSDDLYIDSESQEITNSSGEYSYSKVSLNSGDFPVLMPGNNAIQIKKYNRHEVIEIPTTKNKINSNKDIINVKYMPKDQLIKLSRQSYTFKSYQALIQEQQKTYDLKAYSLMLKQRAEKWTINPTFTSILTSIAKTFSGTGDDVINSLDTSILLYDSSTGEIKCNCSNSYQVYNSGNSGDISTKTVATGGWFKIQNGDSKTYPAYIVYIGNGDTVYKFPSNDDNTIDTSVNNLTITYFPILTTEISDNETVIDGKIVVKGEPDVPAKVEEANGSGRYIIPIGVKHQDIPDWINMKIVYGYNDKVKVGGNNYVYIDKVIYTANPSVAGYYYLEDVTSIFSFTLADKSAWVLWGGNGTKDKEYSFVLREIDWDKKNGGSFVIPGSGLTSKKKEVTGTLYHIYESELPQYEFENDDGKSIRAPFYASPLKSTYKFKSGKLFDNSSGIETSCINGIKITTLTKATIDNGKYINFYVKNGKIARFVEDDKTHKQELIEYDLTKPADIAEIESLRFDPEYYYKPAYGSTDYNGKKYFNKDETDGSGNPQTGDVPYVYYVYDKLKHQVYPVEFTSLANVYYKSNDEQMWSTLEKEGSAITSGIVRDKKQSSICSLTGHNVIRFLFKVPKYSDVDSKNFPKWLSDEKITSTLLNNPGVNVDIVCKNQNGTGDMYQYTKTDDKTGSEIEDTTDWTNIKEDGSIISTKKQTASYTIYHLDKMPEEYSSNVAISGISHNNYKIYPSQDEFDKNPTTEGHYLYSESDSKFYSSSDGKSFTEYSLPYLSVPSAKTSLFPEASNVGIVCFYDNKLHILELVDDDSEANENEGKYCLYSNGSFIFKNTPTDGFESYILVVLNKPFSDGTFNEYFYPFGSGMDYYRILPNSTWYKKGNSYQSSLTFSANTDDTTIYHMKNIPEDNIYPTNGTGYVKTHIEESSDGNPNLTVYKAIHSGYYKIKSVSYWKYYDANDTISNSDINTTLSFDYLTEVNVPEDVSNKVHIKVKPRWWSL